jgi:hypothetical protein
MNSVLVRIWKEEAVTELRYFHGIWLDQVSKTAKNLRTSGVTTEIRSDHHRNTIFFLIRIVGAHSARQPLSDLLRLPRVIRGWRIWWNYDCQGKLK